MFLRVRSIGTGKFGDSHRVNLPNYTLHDIDYNAHVAIVEIPDNAHPLTPERLQHESRESTSYGAVYGKLCEECLLKLHAHFDNKYVAPAGTYRIEQP